MSGVKAKHRKSNKVEFKVEDTLIYVAGGGSKPMTVFCQSKVELDDSGGVIIDENNKTPCESQRG